LRVVKKFLGVISGGFGLGAAGQGQEGNERHG
jgi:hypothetical protein